MEWKEEEEKAKKEYFRVIAEKEKNGCKIMTLAELIDKREAEVQKRRRGTEEPKEKKEGRRRNQGQERRQIRGRENNPAFARDDKFRGCQG